MYNRTFTRFGFCDIQNNQGQGSGYQQQSRSWYGLSASAHGYHKNLIQQWFVYMQSVQRLCGAVNVLYAYNVYLLF